VLRSGDLLGALVVGGLAFTASPAQADDSSSASIGVRESSLPLSTAPGQSYVQFGVAFTIEGVASPGPICHASNAPCILGSGGGIVARAGWRPQDNLYIGGGYEFSKQDPNNLYRLGILQQARAELRRYFPTGLRTNPFVLGAAGLAAYGDEWTVDTWGVTAALGVGIEVELTATLHLAVAVAYRPLYLRAWVDSSTTPHDAGVAHLVGVELALEAQDRIGPSRGSQLGGTVASADVPLAGAVPVRLQSP
jgi:hypothetical protein